MKENEIYNALRAYKTRTGKVLEFPTVALIDMDGTLYNSMPWHAKAWYKIATELGITATEEEFFSYEGMTGKATVNLLYERAFGHGADDAEAQKIYERKSRYFVAENKASIMPGAHTMVKTLRENGIVPVLVTGSAQTTLLDRLSNDFDGEFSAGFRITAHDVTKGKPSPEPYLKGLKLRNAEPHHAVVIENAPLGVKSGHDAGIFTIAVNTGPIPKDELKSAGADLVFDSMNSLSENLPALLSVIKMNSNKL